MSQPNSKRESKRNPKKTKEEEDLSLLPQSQKSSNKTLSNMVAPQMNIRRDQRTAHAEKYPPNDMEKIDSRLTKQYENKEIFKEEAEAGCFKGCYVCCGNCCATLCVTCSICGCGPVKTINQGEIGLVIRFGKVHKKLAPGLHKINNCTDKVVVVDMRLN